MSVDAAARPLINFRDAGGYAAPGGTLRTGRIFRSDNATALAPGDAAALEAIRLARAFDLRSATERRRTASVFSRLEPAPDVTVFDNLTSFNEGELLSTLLGRLVEAQDVAGLMVLYYRQLPAVFAPPLREIFAQLTRSDAPIVVHCRGGKDRTGFVVAAVQRALGVGADDVLRDYLASAGLFSPGPEDAAMIEAIARRTGTRLEPAALAPMMTVEAAYLGAAMAEIDVEYGGFEAYLRDACGVTPEMRDALATQLIARS